MQIFQSANPVRVPRHPLAMDSHIPLPPIKSSFSCVCLFFQSTVCFLWFHHQIIKYPTSSKNNNNNNKKFRQSEKARKIWENEQRESESKKIRLIRFISSSIGLMDPDLWASRLAAAKRQYSLQHHQSSQLGFDSSMLHCFYFGFLGFGFFPFVSCKNVIFFIVCDCFFFCSFFVLDRLSMDDFEMEEEVRPDFPCPYCYEEYDIASLCSHLEDEHSFESKVAVSVEKTKSLLLWLVKDSFFSSGLFRFLMFRLTRIWNNAVISFANCP